MSALLRFTVAIDILMTSRRYTLRCFPGVKEVPTREGVTAFCEPDT